MKQEVDYKGDIACFYSTSDGCLAFSDVITKIMTKHCKTVDTR